MRRVVTALLSLAFEVNKCRGILVAAVMLGGMFSLTMLLKVEAGTTGTLTGTVTSQGHPVVDARVTVSSPSQVASAITGEKGSFIFLSLAPDSYIVSVEKSGYEPAIVRNVSVIADQPRSMTIVLQEALKEIGHVSTRSASALVRPGTTTDVYSVDRSVAEAAQALGGGSNLQNAYSALATVPGVFVPPGQVGAPQVFYIRGGTSDQVGYEYDGVPINRAFDQEPANTMPNLGQQELQVYTGGGPAGTSASGIAGFVNQVIRTGTYPGFADARLGIGTPKYYHGMNIEIGGASPDRYFSYFVGFAGYNQGYRYWNQSNGADLLNEFQINTPTFFTLRLPNLPAVYPNCTGTPPVNDPFGGNPPAKGVAADPGCYFAFNPAFGSISNIADREAVVNLHFAIPHHNDGGRDDIQMLYSSSSELEQAYSSPDDAGPALLGALLGQPAPWPDVVAWPSGVTFGQPATGLQSVPYYYPSSPRHPFQAPLPLDHRDSSWTTDGIVKLQYQKNFGSNAYARLFAYSFYSDLTANGPIAFATGFALQSLLSYYDYNLGAHTRGAELKIAGQLTDKHLLSGTLNYVTATTNRYSSTNFFNATDPANPADCTTNTCATNLTDGTQCYAYASGTISGVSYVPGDPAPCNASSVDGSVTGGTFLDPAPAVQPCPSGRACKALPPNTTWRVTYTGQQGFVNAVKPTFTSASLDDLFRPNAHLVIDAGLRFDRFAYALSDTSGNGREFWFAAARREFCYNPVTNAPVLIPQPAGSFNIPFPPFIGFNCPVDSSSGVPVQTVHPDGLNGHLLFTNTYDHNLVENVVEPRLGLTYAFNADTVLRASYGRYAQAPASALVQYDSKEPNLAFPLFQTFWGYGFTSPRHDAQPLLADNVDLSYERHFKGTDMSLKVTPFYRAATNLLVPINTGNLGIGDELNAGVQQDYGAELQIQKGDFNRDGLSWLLSYTYLQSRERFENYPGTNVNPIDGVNQGISEYNALTKAGGGAPCYANSGDATSDITCGPTSIRNPYYAASRQSLLDRNGWYPTGLNAYLVPHVLTAIVNYRRGPFTITPSLTFSAGTVYGSSFDFAGLDPRTCTQNSAGMTNSMISKIDPLKPDYTSCSIAATPGGGLNIPNPQTGAFDRFDQYREPSQLSLNLALGYELSSRVSVSLTMANVYNSCFGGSRTSWSAAYPPSSTVCGYQTNGFYVSNFYNGTSPNDLGANGVRLNPYFAQPFVPLFADPNVFNFNFPFSAYLQVSIKLSK